jgi:hypothetical protein
MKNKQRAAAEHKKNWDIWSWDERIESNGRTSCIVPEDCIRSDSTTNHNSNSMCPYQNLNEPFRITHTTQQQLTAILRTALPIVYIRAWRHSAYSCLHELWPRIRTTSEHKVRQPLQRLRIFSENNNRGEGGDYSLVFVTVHQFTSRYSPPTQAQFLFSHHIGQPHSSQWRCYTHSKHWLLCWRKKKSQSGKKPQQISFSEIEWERVNPVTFSPEDYNGVYRLICTSSSVLLGYYSPSC